MSELQIEFAEERLTPELAIEGEPLMQAHCREVYKKFSVPMDISVQMRDYFILRDAGVLLMTTARDKKTRKILGYGVSIVSRHSQLGLMSGEIQALRVDESLRGTVYSAEFLKYTEDCIRDRGAVFVRFGVPHKVGEKLAKAGWVAEEVGMYKYLQ